jgi:hypothetical protein
MNNIDNLSLRQLKSLADAVNRRINAIENGARMERLLGRLKVVSAPSDEPASNVKRFGGGFFVEQFSTGNRGNMLYAKTKTGILYRKGFYGWDKVG